jgi:glutathione peroxidase
MNIYDFKVNSIDGVEISLERFKGNALLIVNIASKCGFTYQYEDLQKMYDKYKAEGFEILGLPCNQFAEQEPGNNNDVKQFCMLNYGVSFPLSEKIEVRGSNAHPLFNYLTQMAPFEGFDLSNPSAKLLFAMLKENLPEYLIGDSIKWNFTKFLIDKDGTVVKRFESSVEPNEISPYVKKLL